MDMVRKGKDQKGTTNEEGGRAPKQTKQPAPQEQNKIANQKMFFYVTVI
jgi:hypothetical protein